MDYVEGPAAHRKKDLLDKVGESACFAPLRS